MHRTVLASAVACLLLGSCAATPPDSIATVAQASNPGQAGTRPGADGRLEDMASAALERALQEEQRSHAAERSSLMQKLQAMGDELAELKRRLAEPAAAAPPTTGTPADRTAASAPPEPAAPAPSPAPMAAAVAPARANPAVTAAVEAAIRSSAAAAPGKSLRSGTGAGAGTGSGTSTAASASKRAAVTASANPADGRSPGRMPPLSAYSRVNRETIVIEDKGMIFRVMHGFARTEFHPSKALQQQLLQAARAGKHIEIRGRTDASTANDIDREIALRRALNARVFLANNGIHPRKMRINYLSAGDHVADNSTAEGRARNRRVEIETSGMSPDVLEDLAAVIRQDLQ